MSVAAPVQQPTGGLDVSELAVMGDLVAAVRMLQALPGTTPGALHRFAHQLHVPQGLLGMRALARAHPDFWLWQPSPPRMAPAITVPSVSASEQPIVDRLQSALARFAALPNNHPLAVDEFADSTARLLQTVARRTQQLPPFDPIS
jgi:hypothetical protein